MAYVSIADRDHEVEHHDPQTFITKYVWSQDHKVIAIQYSITAILVGVVALVLSGVDSGWAREPVAMGLTIDPAKLWKFEDYDSGETWTVSGKEMLSSRMGLWASQSVSPVIESLMPMTATMLPAPTSSRASRSLACISKMRDAMAAYGPPTKKKIELRSARSAEL